MSKPWGLNFTLNQAGDLDLKVNRSSDIEDRVWDIVPYAIDAGWTPHRLISEIGQAWSEILRERAKQADQEFDKLRPKPTWA